MSSYRLSHLHKGRDYHDTFVQNPRRARMWRLEQRLLRHIVRQHFSDRPVSQLDFACGTGRIVSFLAPYVTRSTGVDVSASMLAVARELAPQAKFVESDILQDNALGDERFDLITAFRFFPRAEPELRTAAMKTLAKLLRPNGLLVFNNHCHSGGMTSRLIRLLKGRHVTRGDGMTHEEGLSLIRESGLRLIRVYHLGIVPDSEARPLRPHFLASWIEHCARFLPLAWLSENLIYVCTSSATTAVECCQGEEAP